MIKRKDGRGRLSLSGDKSIATVVDGLWFGRHCCCHNTGLPVRKVAEIGLHCQPIFKTGVNGFHKRKLLESAACPGRLSLGLLPKEGFEC